MTAFTTANLPSNINTIEELAAWAMSALAEINPTVTLTTQTGIIEQAATAQTFRFAAQDVSPERLIVVGYLPLISNWRSQGKIWSNGIAELSGAALPTGYLTN